MKVPLANLGQGYRKHKAEYDEAYFRVMNAGDLILRKDVSDFEQNITKYIGTRYAVGLNSGTDALFLSLLALGIGKGDEVRIPFTKHFRVPPELTNRIPV